jgi:hypothetical protein
MPRKVRQVVAGLKAKGFSEDRDSHHVFFVYETIGGLRSTVRTRISHQSGGGDISDNLLGAMARQVGLKSRRDFEQLVDCPLSREAYEAEVNP